MDYGRMISSGAASQLPWTVALNEFKQARRQAALELITSRLRRRSIDLLPYEEIAGMLQVRGRSERGVQDIPVAAIVGSVGRYKDFTRSFLPRHDWDAQRWASVKTAGHVADLPPIDVYKIGEAYFVLDGNHRVSIARRLGLEYIQASVIEVQTRVPLSPNVQPDELIIKAEQASFLASTKLDELRPSANLQVTIPGQYEKLENHIEVHRFLTEMAEGGDLSDNEAVIHWHDNAYLPIIEAIREQGILHEFPDRTETDLYLWLATHQAQLRNSLGWTIRPGTAVSQLSDQFRQTSLFNRAYRKVLDVVVPEGWQGQSCADWAQEKLLDRYSQNLFTEILVPLGNGMDQAVQQAIAIAQRENGRVVGLYTGTGGESDLRLAFNDQCAAAEVEAVWVAEPGNLIEIIRLRARLADLVVVAASQISDKLIPLCGRPMLITADHVSSLNKALLVTESVEDNGLFAAAYLAEQWQTKLVVLTEKPQQTILDYLDIHEVEALFVDSVKPLVTAVAQKCDLIISSRHSRYLKELSQQDTIPILIC